MIDEIIKESNKKTLKLNDSKLNNNLKIE